MAPVVCDIQGFLQQDTHRLLLSSKGLNKNELSPTQVDYISQQTLVSSVRTQSSELCAGTIPHQTTVGQSMWQQENYSTLSQHDLVSSVDVGRCFLFILSLC